MRLKRTKKSGRMRSESIRKNGRKYVHSLTTFIQRTITSAISKMDALNKQLSDLRGSFVASPISAAEIDSTLADWLAKLHKLNEGDQLRHIVQKGESDNVEFKESLSLDVKRTQNDKTYTSKKEPRIEQAVLKTIVAFFNTKGGILLIGVSDDGEFLGVDNEIHEFHKDSFDKFLLHYKNLFRSRIGLGFYPFHTPRIVTIDSKKVLRIDCQPSLTACYLDKKEFYVRTNPATDQLEGPELVEYIKNHFKP